MKLVVFSANLVKKGSRHLPTETMEAVMKFFYDETISRVSPNLHDVVIVRDEHRNKVTKPKRLLLESLKSVYEMFKKQHESDNFKISFSKFCKLKPVEFRNADSRGVHNVCVCMYHQNVKMILEAIGGERATG